LAIATVAALNISYNLQKNDLAAISLANVEALADGENPLCPDGCLLGGLQCYCYIIYFGEHNAN
jgi:hypothetical protein